MAFGWLRWREGDPRRYRLAGYPFLLSILAAGLTFVGAGEPLESTLGLRLLYLLRGAETPPPNALIVAVDEPSIAYLNARASGVPRADPAGPLTAADIAASDFARDLPALARCMPPGDVEALSRSRNKLDIPRTLHACMLPILTARNPSVIAFDILFEERGLNPESDRMLAGALAAAPNAIVLQEVRVDRDTGAVLRRFPTGAIRAAVAGPPERMAAFAVDNLGGSTRYVERFAAYPEVRTLPSMALDLHLGRPIGDPPPENGGDRHGAFWLYGPPGALPVVTLRDVFERADAALPSDLSGVAVFVGAWDEVVKNVDDSFATPLSGDAVGDHSGVELAATAFLNKLEGKALQRPDYPLRAVLVGLIAFAMLALGRLLTGYRGAIGIAVAAVLWAGAAWWAFAALQLWLPFAAPLLIIAPVAGILAIGANYARVRDVVQRLAPRPIARLLIAQRDRGPMEMREEIATILFADLTGSTGIAENIPVREFKDLMNAFFDMAATAVEGERGMIDKFIGDGFMALFTESFTGPDHADRAVTAARRLARDVRMFNLNRKDKAAPTLTMRAGLNTGLIALGEVGARNRANPTAVGDVVNVAARLEQLGRDMFPGEREVILMSGATRHALSAPTPEVADCGERHIRGRKTPVRVIRLTM